MPDEHSSARMKKTFPSQSPQYYYPEANISGRSAANCQSIFNRILPLPPKGGVGALPVHPCKYTNAMLLDKMHLPHMAVLMNQTTIQLVSGAFSRTKMDSFYGPVGLQNRCVGIYSLGAVSQNILEIICTRFVTRICY